MTYDPNIHTIVLKHKSYGDIIITYYMKTILYNKLIDKNVDQLLIYCGFYIKAASHDY